jgi:energy-coupling factor transporter transmembrane protein EcfT
MIDNNDEYIEKVIKEKQLSVRERYNSFKQRLSIAIAVLTLLVTLILFVLKDYLTYIFFLFEYIKKETLATISILSIILIFSILILYNVFQAVYLLFRSLEPLTLQHIDYESIEYFKNGKYEKGKEIYFRDLISSNDANEKELNEKYTDINRTFFYLLKAIIFTLILIIIIFLLTMIMELYSNLFDMRV